MDPLKLKVEQVVAHMSDHVQLGIVKALSILRCYVPVQEVDREGRSKILKVHPLTVSSSHSIYPKHYFTLPTM